MLAVSGAAEGEFVPGPWTNAANRFDVNGDAVVDNSDALVALGARFNPAFVGQQCVDDVAANFVSSCTLLIPKPAGAPSFDVTGDGLISDDDIVQISAVINSSPATIYVSPEASRFRLTTTESGGTAIFSISLIPAPTADVTIAIASSNTAEGTVSTDSLTFTPSQSIHQVTVTGVADSVVDGDQGYGILIGDSVSADGRYNGIQIEDLPVINMDASSTTTLDFGDLPDSYATTLSSNGPRHAVGSLFLGDTVDFESDAIPTSLADGDGADEDGVSLVASLVAGSTTGTLGSFSVVSSLPGKLDAWIDFNNNGSFEHPSEHLAAGTSLDVSQGLNLLPVQVPAGSTPGQVAARFRLSNAGGLSPTGSAADGEVEDYFFTLLDGSTGGEVELIPQNGNARISADGDDVVVTSNAMEIFRVPGSLINSIQANGDATGNTIEIDNIDAIFSGTIKADGGGGLDSLVLAGANQAVDLTTLASGDIAGFEIIDLSGSGDNSLTINETVVEALSTSTDTLRLVYDAGDVVDFGNGWIVQPPEIIGGTYQHVVTSSTNDARLEITNAFPHQNPVDPLDTNRMNGAQVIDPLLVINAIARGQGGALTTPTTTEEIPAFYLDVRADNEVTAIDALRIINFLALGGAGQSEGSFGLLTLSGSNAYAGTTRVDRGFLQLSRTQEIEPLSKLSISTESKPAEAPQVASSPIPEPQSTGTISETETDIVLLASLLSQNI